MLQQNDIRDVIIRKRHHESILHVASFFINILLRCYVIKLFNTGFENVEILS